MERTKQIIETEWKNKMSLAEKREKDIGTKLHTERDQAKALQLQLTELNEAIKQARNDAESAAMISAQLNERNAELQNQNAKLQQQIALFSQTANGERNDMDVDKLDSEQLMRIFRDEIRNEMSVLTNDIEARIRVEHEKMTAELANLTAHYDRSPRRKRVLNATATTFAPTTSSNASHEITFDTHLQPPDERTTAKRSVYEIHLSKFKPTTTEDDIVRHIVLKTDVDKNMFSVDKLIPSKPRDYVSFKLVMLQQTVYEKLIDPNLWPRFTARDFMPEVKPNDRRFGNGNKNSRKMVPNKSRFSNDMRKQVLRNNANTFHQRMNRNGGTQRVLNDRAPYDRPQTPQRFVTPRRMNVPKENFGTGNMTRRNQMQWNTPQMAPQNQQNGQRQYAQQIQHQAHDPSFQLSATTSRVMQPRGQQHVQMRANN